MILGKYADPAFGSFTGMIGMDLVGKNQRILSRGYGFRTAFQPQLHLSLKNMKQLHVFVEMIGKRDIIIVIGIVIKIAL